MDYTELANIQSSMKDDLKGFESVSYLRYYESDLVVTGVRGLPGNFPLCPCRDILVTSPIGSPPSARICAPTSFVTFKKGNHTIPGNLTSSVYRGDRALSIESSNAGSDNGSWNDRSTATTSAFDEELDDNTPTPNMMPSHLANHQWFRHGVFILSALGKRMTRKRYT